MRCNVVRNTPIPEKRPKRVEYVSMLPPQKRRLLRTSPSLAAHIRLSSHPEEARSSGQSDPREGIASGNMRGSRLSPAPQEVTLLYTPNSGQISTADKNISVCTPDFVQTIIQNRIAQCNPGSGQTVSPQWNIGPCAPNCTV